ncbi:NAD(P)H-hydrate dehydratase [Pedobacter flavus]|uniref:ADP-dependent (S)-NAD(P)H-hydrate dehydratase n=1 Tax=Pedobacter flavus TaxID=3113906 RepID=A0ABU7GYG3_9SPHI|nr:NAD(P)H-hydrate dehydratase [Pedobacter sp. VNH31]MEE1884058.1 NAD(P)H-hydrate dehydratase [Pedobacter sp. VNH31]
MQNLSDLNQVQYLAKAKASKYLDAYIDEFIEAFIPSIDKAEIGVLIGNSFKGTVGLKIANRLKKLSFTVSTYYVFNEETDDASFIKVPNSAWLSIENIKGIKETVLIDAINFSDNTLNNDYATNIYRAINSLNAKIYAIDYPSGFPTEGAIKSELEAIKCITSFTCFAPKINFFFPESAFFINDFQVLLPNHKLSLQNNWQLSSENLISRILKPRSKFSHKGSYGHTLIIGGSTYTMGAALLSCSGSLYSGAGLTTACIPESGLTALNTALPEVMYLSRSDLGKDLSKYSAIAFGCGIGVSDEVVSWLNFAIEQPLIIDADGINVLSAHKSFLNKLKPGSIITPHIKEFDRLFGEHNNWWERIETATKKAKELQVFIVLKNQYSFIITPSDVVYINQSGNPAMSSGGMGDVLTGIITGLLAQGYSAEEACIIGCFIHGKAADELSKTQNNVIASAVAKEIPKVIKNLMKGN